MLEDKSQEIVREVENKIAEVLEKEAMASKRVKHMEKLTAEKQKEHGWVDGEDRQTFSDALREQKYYNNTLTDLRHKLYELKYPKK